MELDFVLDLHAHSSLQGVFVYGNTYDDVYRCENDPYLLFEYLLHCEVEVIVNLRRYKLSFVYKASRNGNFHTRTALSQKTLSYKLRKTSRNTYVSQYSNTGCT
jgi:hypothetical protein